MAEDADEYRELRDHEVDPVVGTPLRLLGLPRRAFNSLIYSGVRSIEDLDRWSDRDLLTIHNFGRRGVDEARAAVARWRGQDHVERLAHYLRRNLPREERERLAALLTVGDDERDETTKGGAVPAVEHAIAYLDHQIAATDPRVTAWVENQVRPALRRIRDAVEAADASLDKALGQDGGSD